MFKKRQIKDVDRILQDVNNSALSSLTSLLRMPHCQTLSVTWPLTSIIGIGSRLCGGKIKFLLYVAYHIISCWYSTKQSEFIVWYKMKVQGMTLSEIERQIAGDDGELENFEFDFIDRDL